MEERQVQEYIANITKASTYFVFNNGPVKDLLEQGKINEEDMKNIQRYLQNHLAYLYTVLLEENNIKKFDLVVSTMNQFYVNDDEKVKLEDGGFDMLFDGLFPKVNNINLNLK